MTEYIISTIRFTRQNFLKLVENYDIERMNRIPTGFRNNLVWNLGHLISAQQMLCYEQSDTPPAVGKTLIDAYRPATFPPAFVDETELQSIKALLIKSVDQLERDYSDGIFGAYRQRQSKYGVLLTNIDEAISYVSAHEALHLGYARALVKML